MKIFDNYCIIKKKKILKLNFSLKKIEKIYICLILKRNLIEIKINLFFVGFHIIHTEFFSSFFLIINKYKNFTILY